MAATSTMVQMNTRIDRTLKQEGDRVFKAMGFSPSEAVRGFYRFACSHAMDRATLDPVLSQTEEADELPFRTEEPLEPLRFRCRSFSARSKDGPVHSRRNRLRQGVRV